LQADVIEVGVVNSSEDVHNIFDVRLEVNLFKAGFNQIADAVLLSKEGNSYEVVVIVGRFSVYVPVVHERHCSLHDSRFVIVYPNSIRHLLSHLMMEHRGEYGAEV
jgi:tRNA threonylcarbamoyladenosine modification (KEOPS) complex Cgi121 subunit